MSHVYISFLDIDREFVGHLATQIGNAGHKVSPDLWNIDPITSSDIVTVAIEDCDYFVFVVSPESVAPDSNTLKELNQAQLLQNKPIFISVVARPTASDLFPTAIMPNLELYHDFTIQAEVALTNLLSSLEVSTSTNRDTTAKALAVMGVRGGIGKGTFVAGAAQVLAEVGYDVAIVDIDIDGSGSTLDAQRRWRNLPVVKTVYDHITPYTKRFKNQQGSDNEALWDITPEYLRERNLGCIWMIPAAPENNLYLFDAIPDIPDPREPDLAEIMDDVLSRIHKQQPNVQFVLFDCGAGLNPIFSAAFEKSLAGYILLSPDSAFFGVVERIKLIHANRFRASSNPRLGIFTVANLVTSADDIKRLEAVHPSPIAYIPRNPAMQQYAFYSPVDFDLGFDDVYRAIHQALQTSLEYEVRLPSEFEIRLARWWRTFLANDIANHALQSNQFRLQLMGLFALSIIFGLVALGLVIYSIYQQFTIETPSGIGSFFIFVAILVAVASGYYAYQQQKRRFLLKQASQLGTQINEKHYKFLEDLRESDPKLLKYLNLLVTKYQRSAKGQQQFP